MATRIGELLVSEGRISPDQLTRALELQNMNARGMRLGGILLRWGLLAEEHLLQTLARFHRCPAVDWPSLSAAPSDAVRQLSPAQATRLNAMPYAAEKKSLHVAFVNPSDLAAIDEVKAITGKRVIPTVTSEVRLLQAHQQFYKRPLSRDLWTVLQKLERRKTQESLPLPAPSPSAPTAESPDAPGAFAPDPTAMALADQREPGPSGAPGIWAASAPDSQLLSGLPNVSARLLEPETQLEDVETAEEEAPARVASAAIADMPVEPVDPFSDDWPLTRFLEDALASFSDIPNAEEALAQLDEDEVEDLDPPMEDTASPAPQNFDSTWPSAARQRERGAEAL